ncbi:hypothetical protein GCM10022415_26020 [Knoellia locipacati]|uniref:Uncharacterized protein n=1 Tax=Knoellia locipacati TaxID=882824 RepID=A0A512T381_9MICO|nr:hypothetical protein KLO01_25980 [Knoellia locipacati]
MLETDSLTDGVDEVVDPRHPLVVGAGETGETQGGPLDRHRRVLVGNPDDGPADRTGELAGPADVGPVELEEGALA